MATKVLPSVRSKSGALVSRKDWSSRFLIDFSQAESLTKQAFKDESDMNNILRKYAQTGVLPAPTATVAEFLDVSSVPRYQDSLNTVIRAQTLFSQLPAGVRQRFRNDPSGLMEFLADTSNRDEAVKLGLISRDVPVSGVSTPVLDTKAGKEPKATAQPLPAVGEGPKS